MQAALGKEPLPTRQLLGAVLQEEGKINQAQLAEAMRIKARERLPLGQILVRLGHVSEDDVARAVAKGAGLAYVNLDELSMDPRAMELLPESLARRHNVLPLAMDEETLHVAVAAPLSVQIKKLLERGARKRLKEHIALGSKIREHVERIYERGILESNADAGAAEIVATFIERAIRLKASDIHLEALEDRGRLRFRVDGMLREVENFPPHLMPSLVSRIKVMAGMDIADTRQPQDGAFQQQGGLRPMDVRVSTLPSIHGEKVVMRLLASGGERLTLSSIGLSQDNCDTFQELIRRPHGIILIVGPTGSGKSTTLTAALTTINTIDINITTVEEPVEYKLAGITQVHVGHNSKISFAAALRTILRQDPDVIMVGEVRDTETAEIALRAALTGHLVFTTLHTNDAPSALPRLVDMGCEPFLVASSVTCVLAQRLVRVLCPRCREAYVPEPAMLAQLEVDGSDPALRWYKPVGCPLCQHIGYRGRTGVFEMMVVDAAIRAATMRGESAEALRALALEAGMRTMRLDALPRLATGQTSVAEVLRVTVAG